MQANMALVLSGILGYNGGWSLKGSDPWPSHPNELTQNWLNNNVSVPVDLTQAKEAVNDHLKAVWRNKKIIELKSAMQKRLLQGVCIAGDDLQSAGCGTSCDFYIPITDETIGLIDGVVSQDSVSFAPVSIRGFDGTGQTIELTINNAGTANIIKQRISDILAKIQTRFIGKTMVNFIQWDLDTLIAYDATNGFENI